MQIRTMTIQDARARVTVCMLTEMADESSAAQAALEYLQQLQPDLRGAAVFANDGVPLAALGPMGPWAGAGSALLSRIDASAGSVAKEAHVATETGEVFVITGAEMRLAAVSDRFVLASLLTFDMRTALRQLEAS